VVVAALTRTVRGLTSELPLGPEDGLPAHCVASFDNLHTLRREAFRRPIARLGPARLDAACQVLARSLGCV
jgi:mRNA interferase MazF